MMLAGKRTRFYSCTIAGLVFCMALLLLLEIFNQAQAQAAGDDFSSQLKQMDLSQLMDLEIFSVSKPEAQVAGGVLLSAMANSSKMMYSMKKLVFKRPETYTVSFSKKTHWK